MAVDLAGISPEMVGTGAGAQGRSAASRGRRIRWLLRRGWTEGDVGAPSPCRSKVGGGGLATPATELTGRRRDGEQGMASSGWRAPGGGGSARRGGAAKAGSGGEARRRSGGGFAALARSHQRTSAASGRRSTEQWAAALGRRRRRYGGGGGDPARAGGGGEVAALDWLRRRGY
nr:glycine-rich RNA-binding protein 8-like [Aegilops tauschii subsp. strangulata]